MKILTRYVIRAHVGPFLFAFTAVTGLLFLNAVAQRLEDLVGRGLEWSVVGEFMLLSFPHIVALTFPMSILVAVLYAFSDMTGENEVAAVAGGGIHPVRLMAPMVGVGLLLSGVMFVFNDRVLPESNHRLSALLTDVGSKSPTFELREEVINEIHTGDDSQYFLRARSIDPATNRLQDVTIFDLSNLGEMRTIVADHGSMAFTPDLSDLYLTLENGVVFEVADDRPGTFQRLEYRTQILPLRGVGQEFERRGGGARSDREMNIAMLQARVNEHRANVMRVADESHDASLEAVRNMIGPEGGPDEVEALAAPREAPDFSDDEVIANVVGLHRINQDRWNVYRLSSYRYEVEIHKKYAIAFACLIFVLLGPPLAIRFPQGGVGMVIAASVGIFFFYWMGLIGGERFADRGQIQPVVGMWLPNVVLLLPALYLLTRVSGQISTNRGSSWDEFTFRVKDAVGRWTPGRKRRRREEVTAT